VASFPRISSAPYLKTPILNIDPPDSMNSEDPEMPIGRDERQGEARGAMDGSDETRAAAVAPGVVVPMPALRRMLASCRQGLSPSVAWSENRPRMDQQAMQIRGEMLGEIESQLERLLAGGC